MDIRNMKFRELKYFNRWHEILLEEEKKILKEKDL